MCVPHYVPHRALANANEVIQGNRRMPDAVTTALAAAITAAGAGSSARQLSTALPGSSNTAPRAPAPPSALAGCALPAAGTMRCDNGPPELQDRAAGVLACERMVSSRAMLACLAVHHVSSTGGWNMPNASKQLKYRFNTCRKSNL